MSQPSPQELRLEKKKKKRKGKKRRTHLCGWCAVLTPRFQEDRVKQQPRTHSTQPSSRVGENPAGPSSSPSRTPQPHPPTGCQIIFWNFSGLDGNNALMVDKTLVTPDSAQLTVCLLVSVCWTQTDSTVSCNYCHHCIVYSTLLKGS